MPDPSLANCRRSGPSQPGFSIWTPGSRILTLLRSWPQELYDHSSPQQGFGCRRLVLWPPEITISEPVAHVSGWSVGHTSRRARCPALVGLQLRQYELQRSTLVLLAQRRASEGDKNGSVGQAVADAFGAERCVAGMEVAERIQRTWGFCFPVPSYKGKKPLDVAAVQDKLLLYWFG